MEETKKGRFSAGLLTFAVRHELWDGTSRIIRIRVS